jgi:hypothetical protein
MLLEEVGIFLMANGESRQGNEPGFVFRVGMMNQVENVRHGIANDLAFGPAKRGRQSF